VSSLFDVVARKNKSVLGISFQIMLLVINCNAELLILMINAVLHLVVLFDARVSTFAVDVEEGQLGLASCSIVETMSTQLLFDALALMWWSDIASYYVLALLTNADV
jgi:hypothetical protein